MQVYRDIERFPRSALQKWTRVNGGEGLDDTMGGERGEEQEIRCGQGRGIPRGIATWNARSQSEELWGVVYYTSP